MNDYRPGVGDVVLNNGIPVVVVKIVNYEDVGSCRYDRKYLLCEQSYVEENEGLLTSQILKNTETGLLLRG